MSDDPRLDPDPPDERPVSDLWLLLGYVAFCALAVAAIVGSPWLLLIAAPLVWLAWRGGARWRKVGLGAAIGLGFVAVVYGLCVGVFNGGRIGG